MGEEENGCWSKLSESNDSSIRIKSKSSHRTETVRDELIVFYTACEYAYYCFANSVSLCKALLFNSWLECMEIGKNNLMPIFYRVTSRVDPR